ncbi:MAG: tRNA (adenosine(37)-N6)-dimethylallyltransferase MiaA [Nitrospirota bacterium]
MKKVIVLLGPTAVGKTAASLLLAKALKTEIISADSMQIYRRMNIGTAKPTAEERRQVPHHLIDVVEPWEAYSTGEYIKQVVPIMERLFSSGRPPLVVGGTGLYIKAMTRGIFTGPSADWELRDDLLRKESEEPGSLYAYLNEIDPGTAERIEPADTRRVIRALEVCLKSSRKMSELHQELTRPLPYDFLKMGLTRDRKELYGMIDKRVDAMMAQGLLDEVRRVARAIDAAETRRCGGAGKGTVSPCHRIATSSFTSMQAIGYKELITHLSGEISLDEAAALIKKRSRNYAKRQFTWFRKEEGITWIDITGIHDAHEIFRKIKEIIQRAGQENS